MTALVAKIGIAALASLFLLGGVNKILTWQATLERMEAVGLVPAVFLLSATIALELIGGAALIYGRLPGAVFGLLLVVFTLTTNLFFHRFWALDGDIAALELSLFFKNLAIAGALLFVSVHHWEGAGSTKALQ